MSIDVSLLKVQNLQLSIGGISILQDIDFSVDAGQILGIVGESGSGKSMTAYAIMRLLPDAAMVDGDIFLGETNLNTLTEKEMCAVRGYDIAMVFQEPMTALNPLQCIGDQIAEAVKIHQKISRAEARRITLDTLTRVELPPAEFPPSRYPHELSGGQRQRVVIAMAIALKPRLLIADEPTTALDVTTQAQLLKLLKKLVTEEQMGLILISHDLAVIADTADHIAVMRNGVVVEFGSTEKIFTTMHHPYTRELMQASTHVPKVYARDEQPVNAQPLLVVDKLIREYRLPHKKLFDPPAFFRAVDEVSFSINRGENVGLVGESGCGKSTLTRAILGLESVQGGSIAIDGEKVSASGDMGLLTRRKLQVVFQDPYSSFNPRHKVGRLIAEPLHALNKHQSKREKNEAVISVLERVGLSASDTTKYIHEFSGGQRQRLAIARALISRPSLIILDESVSALDVSIRAKILDLLAEVSASFDIAYLFISHDLSVVRSVTDRVLVMKDGRIVEEGATEAVFRTPQHPYTKNLIKAAPRITFGAGR